MKTARHDSELESALASDDEARDFTATSDGRYRVVGFLGSGGMGSVFEVEHTRLGRSFALKLLRRDLAKDALVSQRFEREARTLASLESDYIVSIVDSGLLAHARPYFVMERLRGADLRQVLAGLPEVPVARAVNLAIDVCLGLQIAHARGLVHRDLKPENLFVTAVDGGRERCKLLDFGVAKQADIDQTRPGALIGTARYMAPEQVAHNGELGPRADVFALGVILHRCLSGKHPFESDSLERVLYKIMNEPPPPIAREAVPRELEAIVLRALSKQPQLRPDSALAFARELLPFANTIRELAPSSPWRVEVLPTPQVGEGEPTPAVGLLLTQPLPHAMPSVVASKPRRWLGPAVASGCVVLAAWLGAVWAGSSARSRPPRLMPAETSSASPVSIDPTAPPPPSASTSAPAAPGATTAPLGPASVGPRPTTVRAPRPSKSAPASAAPRSPNWFDPRNPYGD